MSFAIQNSENEIQSIWSMTTGSFFFFKMFFRAVLAEEVILNVTQKKTKGRIAFQWHEKKEAWKFFFFAWSTLILLLFYFPSFFFFSFFFFSLFKNYPHNLASSSPAFKSFMKMLKCTGSKMDPRRATLMIRHQTDVTPFKTTLCTQLMR